MGGNCLIQPLSFLSLLVYNETRCGAVKVSPLRTFEGRKIPLIAASRHYLAWRRRVEAQNSRSNDKQKFFPLFLKINKFLIHIHEHKHIYTHTLTYILCSNYKTFSHNTITKSGQPTHRKKKKNFVTSPEINA